MTDFTRYLWDDETDFHVLRGKKSVEDHRCRGCGEDIKLSAIFCSRCLRKRREGS